MEEGLGTFGQLITIRDEVVGESGFPNGGVPLRVKMFIDSHLQLAASPADIYTRAILTLMLLNSIPPQGLGSFKLTISLFNKKRLSLDCCRQIRIRRRGYVLVQWSTCQGSDPFLFFTTFWIVRRG